jgi:hypothetical protein
MFTTTIGGLFDKRHFAFGFGMKRKFAITMRQFEMLPFKSRFLCL